MAEILIRAAARTVMTVKATATPAVRGVVTRTDTVVETGATAAAHTVEETGAILTVTVLPIAAQPKITALTTAGLPTATVLLIAGLLTAMALMTAGPQMVTVVVDLLEALEADSAVALLASRYYTLICWSSFALQTCQPLHLGSQSISWFFDTLVC